MASVKAPNIQFHESDRPEIRLQKLRRLASAIDDAIAALNVPVTTTSSGTDGTFPSITGPSFVGRISGTGAAVAIAPVGAITMLPPFSATTAGLTPSPGSATGTRFLRDDGAWVAPSLAVGAILHGDLGGLSADDHPQYLLRSATLSLTGAVTGTTGFTTDIPSITVTLTDDTVTDAKLRDSAGLSVIGRSTNSTGNPADIIAASDGQVLRRSGTTLAFAATFPATLTWDDNAEVRLGTGGDLRLFHDGTNSTIRNDTGDLSFLLGATEIARLDVGDSRFQVGDGSVTLASTGFISDPDTGFYRIGANRLGFTANGTHIVEVDGSRMYVGVLGSAATGVTGLVSAQTTTYLQNTVQIVGVAAPPSLGMYRVNTSLAAPSAVLSGQVIFQFVAAGYRTSAAPGVGIGAAWRFNALENYTSTAIGTNCTVLLVPVGSITPQTAMQVDPDAFLTRDGAVGAPGRSFISDPDTGRYRIGANNMGDAVGGALVWEYLAARVRAYVPVRLPGYTVATLPAGAVGDTAYVTDSLAPAFGVAVVGGGAVVIPVFYNGVNWIVG